jgi:hypothetical protein
VQRQRFEQDVDQLLLIEVWRFFEDTDCEHQKTRCAEAALQGMVPHERFLHRVQLVALLQSFDGADAVAVRLHGEHQTGAYRLIIDKHLAGAADAVLAADMSAGLSTTSRGTSTSVRRGSAVTSQCLPLITTVIAPFDHWAPSTARYTSVRTRLWR